MIINNERALAYIVNVDETRPLPGYDRVKYARTNGWWCIVGVDEVEVGDKAVYFEIDSLVPNTDERFAFMEKRSYRVKTQKMCKVVSQGLMMSLSLFPELGDLDVGTDVTKKLNIKYYEPEDNARKRSSDPNAKYKSMGARHPKLAKKQWFRWLMKREWGRKLMFVFFGRKKDNKNDKGFPVGKFAGVSKTDQERCENMPWILNDKTPFIVTQKCDGSSGTYILERLKKNKYEFYVCSRNVRMLKPEQECFYKDKNYYWEVAQKYNIEECMKDYLNNNPDISFVCWQGEICAPAIQKNPHNLTETHFYAFHMTDSKNGRYDIREASKIWEHYGIEIVPIICDNYIMPNDFEEFKISADGVYDPKVCEGHIDCKREGFVYYKTTDPNFSFKNVSRKYLMKHDV